MLLFKSLTSCADPLGHVTAVSTALRKSSSLETEEPCQRQFSGFLMRGERKAHFVCLCLPGCVSAPLAEEDALGTVTAVCVPDSSSHNCPMQDLVLPSIADKIKASRVTGACPGPTAGYQAEAGTHAGDPLSAEFTLLCSCLWFCVSAPETHACSWSESCVVSRDGAHANPSIPSIVPAYTRLPFMRGLLDEPSFHCAHDIRRMICLSTMMSSLCPSALHMHSIINTPFIYSFRKYS